MDEQFLINGATDILPDLLDEILPFETFDIDMLKSEDDITLENFEEKYFDLDEYLEPNCQNPDWETISQIICPSEVVSSNVATNARPAVKCCLQDVPKCMVRHWGRDVSNIQRKKKKPKKKKPSTSTIKLRSQNPVPVFPESVDSAKAIVETNVSVSESSRLIVDEELLLDPNKAKPKGPLFSEKKLVDIFGIRKTCDIRIEFMDPVVLNAFQRLYKERKARGRRLTLPGDVIPKRRYVRKEKPSPSPEKSETTKQSADSKTESAKGAAMKGRKRKVTPAPKPKLSGSNGESKTRKVSARKNKKSNEGE